MSHACDCLWLPVLIMACAPTLILHTAGLLIADAQTRALNAFRDATVISMAHLRTMRQSLAASYPAGRCHRQGIEDVYCEATGHTHAHAALFAGSALL